ncbi:MAG: hypothetical protein AAGD92_02170 [Pseudomonadota bacterium]
MPQALRSIAAHGRNRLSPPVDLVGPMQTELWEKYIVPAHWLTTFDTARAHMWCVLQAEFLAEPKAFNAAMISQLRALGSELGLDPSSRARMGKKVIKAPVKDDENEFLT